MWYGILHHVVDEHEWVASYEREDVSNTCVLDAIMVLFHLIATRLTWRKTLMHIMLSGIL